jgi:CBS-domain-containing membrane protein
MTITRKPFAELTAADVMSREVIAVPKHQSLRAAARMLAGSHISGAPVVDHTGRCVGVLSTTDFVEWAGREGTMTREGSDKSACVCEWEIITTKVPENEQVRDWMTSDLVMSLPTASLCKLARCMIDAHVHRVIVAGEDGKPIGVVSSTDILAAVAYANKTSATGDSESPNLSGPHSVTHTCKEPCHEEYR